MIEEQIDIRIIPGGVVRDRTEQEKALDAELFELGFVSFQDAYDIGAFHRAPERSYAALAEACAADLLDSFAAPLAASFAAFSRASLARICASVCCTWPSK